MRLGCSVHHLIDAGLGFSEVLNLSAELGMTELELGVANRLETPGMSAEMLLTSPYERGELVARISDAGLRIGALNCFGNPLHPLSSAAASDQTGVSRSIELAAILGVNTVVGAVRLPGHSGRRPSGSHGRSTGTISSKVSGSRPSMCGGRWRSSPRPLGVNIALKLHPGQIVYNTATFQRLAAAVGPGLVANIDPAHLFYQGMDPLKVIDAVQGQLGHVHAKDAVINAEATALNGLIDPSPFDDPHRSWRFAAVGDGRDVTWWSAFLEKLRSVGYRECSASNTPTRRWIPTPPCAATWSLSAPPASNA